MITRQGELLRFVSAFGRLVSSPNSRYFHKDLAKLIAQYDDMMATGATRRPAGRPRSPGGWSDLRRKALPNKAHMHLCDHVDSCDDPERPQCQACEMEINA